MIDALSLFNQQILQCQDDAYTLAWYLLGDEGAAEAILQEAVETAFRRFSPHRGNCRALILQLVLRMCRQRPPAKETLPAPEPLTCLERQALVLIEILKLNYLETARITGRPAQEIARLLAHARRKMTHPGSAEVPSP